MTKKNIIIESTLTEIDSIAKDVKAFTETITSTRQLVKRSLAGLWDYREKSKRGRSVKENSRKAGKRKRARAEACAKDVIKALTSGNITHSKTGLLLTDVDITVEGIETLSIKKIRREISVLLENVTLSYGCVGELKEYLTKEHPENFSESDFFIS